MSTSMRKLFNRLSDKLGASYARIRLQWLCQKYWVSQWDECPAEMYREGVYGA